MPVTQLSAAFVQHATCPAGVRKIEYRDTVIIGFSYEKRASGGGTYYLRYFDQNGRQRQLKIGGVNDITFDQARKKAKTLRAEVVLGGDPVGQKREKRTVPTYAELAQQHIEEAKRTQRSWWSTEGIIRKHLLPEFGKLRIDEIHPQRVSKFLDEKKAAGYKPASIDKMRVVLGRSYSLAQRWRTPGSAINPVTAVERPRYDNARHRYLTSEEAQRLRWACEQSSNPQLGAIVGLLLLSGARLGELLQAQWAHVDPVTRLWFIPHTKNGRARHVPLSKPALAIIDQLPRLAGCPYLVPNLDTGKPFVSIKKAWQTARDLAGLSGLHLHDLRHAAASNLVNAGVGLQVVSRILGHKNVQSSQRYAHLSDTTLFSAAEAGANKQAAWTAINS